MRRLQGKSKMQLNPAQQEAIFHLENPLLVLAGAGSGKTRVITQKIAWLVESMGFAPESIAAVTFTNKAATEMRERLAAILGKKAKALQISTFHALGVKILREEAAALNLKKNFSIFDASDAKALLHDLAPNFAPRDLDFLQSLISRWKNANLSAFDVAPESDFERKSIPIFNAYQKALKAYHAVDFDDLIRLPFVLFQQNAQVLAKWQNRLRYLLVDEYQDTNAIQYALFKLLAGARGAFTVVGDNDQSIYAWRGADIQNLERLTVDFPTLKIIKLEQNYRSTQSILNAANALILNNKSEDFFSKKLWSAKGSGEKIRLAEFADFEREAESVVADLFLSKTSCKKRFADFAILYRTNHLAKPFEEALRARQIPYVISGGQSFFEKTEIKDLAAYLRLFLNANDDPAFLRAVNTPTRGIGTAALQTLGNFAARQHLSFLEAAQKMVNAPLFSDSEMLSKPAFVALEKFVKLIGVFSKRAKTESAKSVLPSFLAAIHYESWLKNKDDKTAESRFANLLDLIDWLEERGDSLNAAVQNISLLTGIERKDKNIDAVQLSTLHAAKGLEFAFVYLVGVEEGILPHRDSDVDEERRLMYVGITRAQEVLKVSVSKWRKEKRERVMNPPSRFINEMGLHFEAPQKIKGDAARSRIAAILASLDS